jgi:hypothetical protein
VRRLGLMFPHNGMAPNVGPSSGIALLEFLRFNAAAGVCADKYLAHGGAVMIDKSIMAILVGSRLIFLYVLIESDEGSGQYLVCLESRHISMGSRMRG